MAECIFFLKTASFYLLPIFILGCHFFLVNLHMQDFYKLRKLALCCRLGCKFLFSFDTGLWILLRLTLIPQRKKVCMFKFSSFVLSIVSKLYFS